MPSDQYKRAINATGGSEIPLLLLEINHDGLAVPIRVVADNQDLTHNAHVFTAMDFRATLPDDLESGSPRAQLSIDNVGRELTQWLEETAGGKGATVRMIQVLRSDPDTIEGDVTLDLTNLQVNALEVSGSLGFQDILNQPSIPLTYRPDVAPGLF